MAFRNFVSSFLERSSSVGSISGDCSNSSMMNRGTARGKTGSAALSNIVAAVLPGISKRSSPLMNMPRERMSYIFDPRTGTVSTRF